MTDPKHPRTDPSKIHFVHHDELDAMLEAIGVSRDAEISDDVARRLFEHLGFRVSW